MRRSAPLAALVALALVLPTGGTALAGGPGDGPGEPDAAAGSVTADPEVVEDLTIDRALARAVSANQDLPYAGQLTVVTFSERGPQIAELDLERGEGGVRMVSDAGDEVGRADGTGFLRSSEQLLRVGGVERVPAQLDRLRTKYEVTLGAEEELDTGSAVPLVLAERDRAVVREVLYLDVETGLIVRRETFGRDGQPVRTIAYTSLEVGGSAVTMPASDGLDVEEHLATPGEAAELREAGFVVPDRLPHGYELLAALEVPEASVPTLHLIYGDGLYSVSVFQQQGRMKRTVVDGAAELHAPGGGAVWRWPGSEPRRVVWAGDGATFTALADTPTDELIDVVSGLPIDPVPSTLDRLGRGLQRVAAWFGRGDRSET
jgi:hypothetical protein